MCSNGGYTERGIKQVDGFMAERWRIEPEYAVRVDPALGDLGALLEPATVVAKAWEHVLSIGRARSLRRRRLTGLGIVGPHVAQGKNSAGDRAQLQQVSAFGIEAHHVSSPIEE